MTEEKKGNERKEKQNEWSVDRESSLRSFCMLLLFYFHSDSSLLYLVFGMHRHIQREVEELEVDLRLKEIRV